MDYALAHSLRHNMDHIPRALIFYDVNCQYSKKLRDRLKGNKFISLPSEIELVPAIGAWHIHGHRQECLARYGANFIQGAGRVDGEIMETLWASLNVISPSARGMSTAHRQELLDYQMNDSNFLKMIHMSESHNIYIINSSLTCLRRPLFEATVWGSTTSICRSGGGI